MIRSVAGDRRIESGAFTPIQRPRIIERMRDAALQRIVLLIAPAGYGKSVALTQFVNQVSEPYVRYDVRSDNATLLGFLRGFADALTPISPKLRKTVSGAVEKAHASATRGADLAAWMHSHISSYDGLIIVDDLHVAADPEITKFLAALIERTKNRTRWIIATRSPLDLPVASWLAYADVGLPIEQSDLRFTFDEARDAAASAGGRARDEEVRDILQMTEGWPTALAFALRSSVRSADLRKIETATRDMIYRYLAEQVFQSLGAEEQEVLFFASFLTRIETDVLKAAGFRRAFGLLEGVRARGAFIYEDGGRAFRCHDLFRDFLAHELESKGYDTFCAFRARAADALERAGRTAAALRLFTEAGDAEALIRIVESSGLQLVEQGHGDVVEAAVNALPASAQGKNPTVLAIRALTEVSGGRFDRAERLYRRAIELSNNDAFRVATGIQVLLLLLNQGRNGLGHLLPMVESAQLTVDLRAEATAALAGAHAFVGEIEQARQCIADALNLVESCENEDAKTKTYQRVGFASFYIHDFLRAKEASLEAARLAEKLGLFILAARAYTVLAATSIEAEEDVPTTLWYAQRVVSSATKAGDRLGRQTALMQMYEIEARCGSLEKILEIEKSYSESTTSDPLRLTLIRPLRALVASWEGRFSEAHRLASEVCANQGFESLRVLRTAECAVYFAADAKREEAIVFSERALTSANELVSHSAMSRTNVTIARLLCSVANALLGRSIKASRITRVLDSEKTTPATMTLLRATKELNRLISFPGSDDAFFESLSELRTLGYGGYANLFRAVSAAQIKKRIIKTALTPSERAVLRALGTGTSTKSIAIDSGRSVHTIHAHVRSAISKLGCSGRNQAIAIARKNGLL